MLYNYYHKEIIMHYHKRGFTIIEVSLVLAIAGLILVMAFVALPTLQRQARDSKRKEDTMTFIQALKKYQQNNRGKLPDSNFEAYEDGSGENSIVRPNSDEAQWVYTWENEEYYLENNQWANFYNQYLGEKFKNPDNEKYTFFLIDAQTAPFYFTYTEVSSQNATDENRDADLYIYTSATCQNGEPVKSNNSRNLAIVTLLETGTYCANM